MNSDKKANFKQNLFPCSVEYYTYFLYNHKEILTTKEMSLNPQLIDYIITTYKKFYEQEFNKKHRPLGIEIYKYQTNNNKKLIKSYLIKEIFTPIKEELISANSFNEQNLLNLVDQEFRFNKDFKNYSDIFFSSIKSILRKLKNDIWETKDAIIDYVLRNINYELSYRTIETYMQILIEKGLICFKGIKSGEKGRPKKVYNLSFNKISSEIKVFNLLENENKNGRKSAELFLWSFKGREMEETLNKLFLYFVLNHQYLIDLNMDKDFQYFVHNILSFNQLNSINTLIKDFIKIVFNKEDFEFINSKILAINIVNEQQLEKVFCWGCYINLLLFLYFNYLNEFEIAHIPAKYQNVPQPLLNDINNYVGNILTTRKQTHLNNIKEIIKSLIYSEFSDEGLQYNETLQLILIVLYKKPDQTAREIIIEIKKEIDISDTTIRRYIRKLEDKDILMSREKRNSYGKHISIYWNNPNKYII